MNDAALRGLVFDTNHFALDSPHARRRPIGSSQVRQVIGCSFEGRGSAADPRAELRAVVQSIAIDEIGTADLECVAAVTSATPGKDLDDACCRTFEGLRDAHGDLAQLAKSARRTFRR